MSRASTPCFRQHVKNVQGRDKVFGPAMTTEERIWHGSRRENGESYPHGSLTFKSDSLTQQWSIHLVMPALVAGIHALTVPQAQDRGWPGRRPAMTQTGTPATGSNNKPGHDDEGPSLASALDARSAGHHPDVRS